MRKRTKELTENARVLRREMTDSERKLWYNFLKYDEYHWKKQSVIKPYILDFYCAKAKLCLELDGSQHFFEDGLNYDEARTKFLEGLGIKVLRFTNFEVENNFKEVCEAIYNETRKRTPLSQLR